MSSFAFDIQRFCDLTKERASTVTRLVAMNMLVGVVKTSPVDTGRFRGNWQVSVDTPPAGPLERDDKKPFGSRPGPAVYDAALQALTGFEAGPPIYIANNLPYARRLEYGHSQQAPAGMVRVTVTEFRIYLAKAIAQAKLDAL
jgi:hypothetical protein